MVVIIQHVTQAIAHFVHLLLIFITRTCMQFANSPAVLPFQVDQQGGHIRGHILQLVVFTFFYKCAAHRL